MTRHTSLTKYAPLMREADDTNARAAAKDAYLKSGGKILLINMDWLPNWPLRKLADQIAVAVFNVKGDGRNG